MKKLLVIAYYFPPLQSSGVYRTLAFIRYLASKGWKITVLTLQPDSIFSLDSLGLLPECVEVIRAKEWDVFKIWDAIKRKSNFLRPTIQDKEKTMISHDRDEKKGVTAAVKNQLTALLKTPDSQSGWFLPAILKGACLEKPEIIYSSAPPFTCHVVASLLKCRWKNIPLVIDYRDPWGGNPFKINYGGIAGKWDCYLERWVNSQSDHVIVNTYAMEKLFVKRFPVLSKKTTVITNGFDPEEFEGIESFREVSEKKLLMVHPGTLYGKRSPLVFLRALRIAIHEKGLTDIEVHFMGPCGLFEGKEINCHVQEMGLSKHVALFPSMEHSRVLSIMKGADVLLLLAMGTTLQIPAKLFEYIGIGKTVLGICESESAAYDILDGLGEKYIVTLNTEAEVLEGIHKVYSYWQRGICNNVGGNKLPGVESFSRKKLTDKLDDVLKNLCGT